jgi:hypothetical protein
VVIRRGNVKIAPSLCIRPVGVAVLPFVPVIERDLALAPPRLDTEVTVR